MRIEDLGFLRRQIQDTFTRMRMSNMQDNENNIVKQEEMNKRVQIKTCVEYHLSLLFCVFLFLRNRSMPLFALRSAS